jgi:hypothetical protein
MLIKSIINNCIVCGELNPATLTNTLFKLCKTCRKKCFKNNIHWTIMNERIDNFIQDTAFEWVSFDQFYIIKERKGDFATAIWKDGPSYWDSEQKKYARLSNEKVTLKYFDNEIFEFLNMV